MTIAHELKIEETLAEAFARERPRLVRLCAQLSGDASVAEDLVHETYIEAWRHRGRLTAPEGASRWLSAVARNVCMRWRRNAYNEGARLTPLAAEDAALDLEVWRAAATDLIDAVERDELIDLIGRALAALPQETRAVMLGRYLHDQPQAELAAQLGVSEGAVEARLQRGKQHLRKLFVTELRDEAAELGLLGSAEEWQATRMWCPMCGRARLLGRLPQYHGEFALRCPLCSGEPGVLISQSNSHPMFEGLSGFKPMNTRFMIWAYEFFQPALIRRAVTCQRCGRETPLRDGLPAHVPLSLRYERGVHVLCDACGSSSYSSLRGLVWDLPEARRFWQRHPRVTTAPEQEMTYEGRPALLITLRDVTGAQTLDAILAKDTYQTLHIEVGHE